MRVEFGTRAIGADAPVFVVAEAGVNHDGEVPLAHALVDLAADAGADAVKFQTFEPELLVSRAAPAAAYQRRNAAVASQHELISRLVLPRSAWADIAAHAAERGIGFLSTPFDPASLALLLELGVPLLKVPSGELTNLPYLRELAGCGRPLLVSTGMATAAEVRVALDAVAAAPGVALLHCVSAYPAPTPEANLRAIPAMRDEFGLPVGWSDHTLGATTALGAVALGAALLEKHVTTDRARTGPDHAASADPAGFAAYVAAVRELEAALGTGVKRPAPSELGNRELVRRSWHARVDLRPGQVVAPDDVVLLRPATGLPPDVEVIGRPVARPVAAGAPLREPDLG